MRTVLKIIDVILEILFVLFMIVGAVILIHAPFYVEKQLTYDEWIDKNEPPILY